MKRARRMRLDRLASLATGGGGVAEAQIGEEQPCTRMFRRSKSETTAQSWGCKSVMGPAGSCSVSMITAGVCLSHKEGKKTLPDGSLWSLRQGRHGWTAGQSAGRVVKTGRLH